MSAMSFPSVNQYEYLSNSPPHITEIDPSATQTMGDVDMDIAMDNDTSSYLHPVSIEEPEPICHDVKMKKSTWYELEKDRQFHLRSLIRGLALMLL